MLDHIESCCRRSRNQNCNDGVRYRKASFGRVHDARLAHGFAVHTIHYLRGLHGGHRGKAYILTTIARQTKRSPLLSTCDRSCLDIRHFLLVFFFFFSRAVPTIISGVLEWEAEYLLCASQPELKLQVQRGGNSHMSSKVYVKLHTASTQWTTRVDQRLLGTRKNRSISNNSARPLPPNSEPWPVEYLSSSHTQTSKVLHD